MKELGLKIGIDRKNIERIIEGDIKKVKMRIDGGKEEKRSEGMESEKKLELEEKFKVLLWNEEKVLCLENKFKKRMRNIKKRKIIEKKKGWGIVEEKKEKEKMVKLRKEEKLRMLDEDDGGIGKVKKKIDKGCRKKKKSIEMFEGENGLVFLREDNEEMNKEDKIEEKGFEDIEKIIGWCKLKELRLIEKRENKVNIMVLNERIYDEIKKLENELNRKDWGGDGME